MKETKMEVIRAKRAGACYGVQRALDMAQEVLDGDTQVYTLGSLIHNPQVVASLAEQGAITVKQVSEIPPYRGLSVDGKVGSPGTTEGATAPATVPATETLPPSVVVRSHGVTPEVLHAVEDGGFTVVDATCPHVSRAQKASAELAMAGCRVVVVGEEGHPEVEGLRAWAEQAGGKVDIVANPEDIPAGLYDPIGVVAQTTQRRENLEAVVEALRACGLNPLVKNTICSATRMRQEAAADLSARVDAMVVIGGRNSSNTTRLAEVCALMCPKTFHIESAEELDSAQFEGCSVVGVTAGASTPEDQIAAVEDYLKTLTCEPSGEMSA
jgi:4-hydroxy-3-methylbut-2-enyl diphosphate reductase